MNLSGEFRKHVIQEQLFTSENILLLACSGGPDSMVLLHLLHANGYSVVVAHVNFQLRDQESDADEEFVSTWCKQNQIPFFINRFPTKILAKESGKGIQELARELRYQWFHELLEEGKADLIVTAHHASDQEETILHHLFRGTGLKGLRGMQAKTGMIRRPLLNYPKQILLDYANEQGVSFRTDSSNLSDDYTRNFIRNQILPKIHSLFPGFPEQISSFTDRMKATWHYYHQETETLKQKYLQPDSKGWKINLRELKKEAFPLHLLYEWLHPFGYTLAQCESIIGVEELVQSGARFPVAGCEGIIDRDFLILRMTENKMEFSDLHIHTLPFSFIIGHSIYHLSESTFTGFESDTWWLNRDSVEFPLTARRPLPGDSFRPLGMKGRKKISDLLTDKKISLEEKEEVVLLCAAENILVTLPLQIAEENKITDHTAPCIKITRTKA